MALTMRLDAETDRCLRDLQAESGLDRSALTRQLIRKGWQQRQAPPTISEQLGGPPPAFLSTLTPGGSERDQRRRSVRDICGNGSRYRHGSGGNRCDRWWH